MERAAVRSKEIAIVGYEDETQTLEIAFRNGGVYRYTQVPRDIYDRLMSAESLGVYFEQNVKNKFPYTRLR